VWSLGYVPQLKHRLKICFNNRHVVVHWKIRIVENNFLKSSRLVDIAHDRYTTSSDMSQETSIGAKMLIAFCKTNITRRIDYLSKGCHYVIFLTVNPSFIGPYPMECNICFRMIAIGIQGEPKHVKYIN